jgi:hypothetical protein
MLQGTKIVLFFSLLHSYFLFTYAFRAVGEHQQNVNFSSLNSKGQKQQRRLNTHISAERTVG